MFKNFVCKTGAEKSLAYDGCNVLDRSSAMKNPKKITKKESLGAQIKSNLLFYAGALAVIAVINFAATHIQMPTLAFLPHVSGQATCFFISYAILLFSMPFIFKGAEFKVTKEKLEEMEAVKSTAYTDDVIKLSQQAIEMPVSLPVAWDCLKEATNGLDIKALDKRRAAWLVDSVDDDSRTVKCSLQYIADPLGRKLSQIYPRTIEMIASVDGHGVNTRLRTRYTFATPMDLEAVSEIISKTNSRLNEMIAVADKSVKDQKIQREQMRSASAAGVAQMEKPQEFNFDNLGSIDFPLS
ncbi:MAG: hypothetical protein C0507_14525, partial [Cyanobacteria bacterium PR.3.49]|nr:hypothetical protein [Cyanobacteria bacterium PR.3.49]